MVFYVVISWVNWRKYEKISQFNTDWVASLRTWYYFRFSFSCSGYELTVIRKGHALNCYSFLQKFLLKTQIYILVLVTVVAQFTTFTTKTTKNANYFLSLMSYSINKLKSFQIILSGWCTPHSSAPAVSTVLIFRYTYIHTHKHTHTHTQMYT